MLNNIFFKQNNRSPISILTDCVARVIEHRWKNIENSPNKFSASYDYSSLKTTYEFIEISRKKIAEKTHKKHYEKVSNSHKLLLKRYDYKEENSLFSQILETIIFLIILVLAVLSLVLLPALLVKVIKEAPEAVWGIIAVMTATIAFSSLLTFKKPKWKFQEAFVYGSGYFTQRLFSGEISAYQTKRELIVTLMTQAENQPKNDNESDPDILTIKNGNSIALPPGLSELALASVNDEAISEIRDHLLSVRRLHLVFSSLSFLGFLLAAGVTIYGIVFRNLQAGPQLLGGGGIASVLGLFCFSTLRQLRTSQIALALFSSYIAELKGKLAHAHLLDDPRKTKRACNNAWKDFRQSINDLWVLEEKKRPSFRLKEQG